jgi:hypothetical protein
MTLSLEDESTGLLPWSMAATQSLEGQPLADIRYNFFPSYLICYPRKQLVFRTLFMNISILRDCSPSEVPNFGTDVPNLRTFLRFFLLSEIRRRRISGRPRKRACAKIHPRSEFNPPVFRKCSIHLPRFHTGFLPRFSHTYSETYHPSSD